MKAATVWYFLLKHRNRISIHAAREGGDGILSEYEPEHGISIHAAREGGDKSFAGTLRTREKFQSTPPVKAATVAD